MNKGILLAALTYFVWGLSPIFWKQISHVSAVESVFHRVIWATFLLVGILAYQKRWAWVAKLRDKRIILSLVVGTIVLALNWGLFIWAVNVGFIIDASLGYFINPLISIVFGVLFFRESLRRWQWVAVGLAFAGVLYLTFWYGRFPWIGLTLAFSFALYAVLKKRSPLDSITGLAFEIALMLPIALVFVGLGVFNGDGAFGTIDRITDIFLIATGLMTVIPLVMFAMAAKLIPLAYIGILQYIAPSLQFLIGVFVYGESFTPAQAVGYGIIWMALAILAIEGISNRRQVKPRAPAAKADVLA